MERKVHFMDNWVIFLGIWGEAELLLWICGARQNTFRELRIFFGDLGRSMHYFKESREHRPPWGPHKCWYFNISLSMINTASESLKARKLFIFLHLIFYGQLQFNA